MKKISDYRKHVDECHALLCGGRSPEERQMLLTGRRLGRGWRSRAKRNWAKEGKTEG
jgi:hypothetical protein